MSARRDWRPEAHRMVDRLGPIESSVAGAMARVPRDRFVAESLRPRAYEDEPLPLPYGAATISAPHMVAIQLEWAELRPGHSVLEIGAGSGYLAALVLELVRPWGRYLGLDVEPRLAEAAQRTVESLGYAEAQVRAGDGALGAPDQAPFDRIIVSCATPAILRSWKDQLAPGGTIVAPLGDSYEQRWVRWRPGPSGGKLEEGVACRFVPLQERPRRHI